MDLRRWLFVWSKKNSARGWEWYLDFTTCPLGCCLLVRGASILEQRPRSGVRARPPLLAAEARLAGDIGHRSRIREHGEGEER